MTSSSAPVKTALARLTRLSAACEFGEGLVRAAIFRVRGEKLPEVLGYGEAPAEGFREGRWGQLADAAESMRTAVREAAREARCRAYPSLALSLDDPFLERIDAQGTVPLERGAESFGPRHIQQAALRARQSVRPFDKHLVYQGVARFLVDGEDYLNDPAGIFGKEITAVLVLLFSESQAVQNLERVAERANLRVRRVIPSALAAFHGIFSPDAAREKCSVILAGTRICHILRAFNGSLQSLESRLIYKAYGEEDMNWIREAVKAGEPGKIYLTGPYAENENFAQDLGDKLDTPLYWSGARFSDPAFQSPRFAVLAGLAALWNAPATKPSASRFNLEVLKKASVRAKTFVEEYF